MWKWIWHYIDVLCYGLALFFVDLTLFFTVNTLIFGLVAAFSVALLGFLLSLVGEKGSD
ncbi:hypothetical protein NVV76_05445 [Pediococcus ethanolidurans]|uniref:hypothetical protein n=1 Tax=Pediococcus ethanolidurans TaxID=319653 RepID=UPI0021E7E7D9|nr:hypothetical protein [Pediococcus ethanolidurans]MCV3327604.1 hypothetical protein [Pediococcus ethanolidurans]